MTKVVERKQRKKKLILSNHEKSLLLHPPTEETWLCPNVHSGIGPIPNRGALKSCAFCGQNRPARARKLWPEYKALCDKVGIEPGTRWKLTADGPMARGLGESWHSVRLPDNLYVNKHA